MLSRMVMDVFGIDVVFSVGGVVCPAGTVMFTIPELRRPA